MDVTTTTSSAVARLLTGDGNRESEDTSEPHFANRGEAAGMRRLRVLAATAVAALAMLGLAACGGETEECQPLVPLGVPSPEISVSAYPGAEAGEIRVAVELTNFVLQPAPESARLARGHWHLSIDGGPESMFGMTEVTVPVSTAGEHEIIVSISDVFHCSLGVDAKTTVVVEGDAARGVR